jgi:hypothetical protein
VPISVGYGGQLSFTCDGRPIELMENVDADGRDWAASDLVNVKLRRNGRRCDVACRPDTPSQTEGSYVRGAPGQKERQRSARSESRSRSDTTARLRKMSAFAKTVSL